MTKISLGSDEICAILKTCGESQVTELQFGDLYVRFDRTVEMPVAQPSLSPVAEDSAPLPAAEIAESRRLIEQDAEDSLDQDELAMRDEQVANMLVENPLLAEQLLIKGELEKNADSEAD